MTKDKKKLSIFNRLTRLIIVIALALGALLHIPATSKHIKRAPLYKKLTRELDGPGREVTNIKKRFDNLSRTEKTAALFVLIFGAVICLIIKRKKLGKDFLYKICDEIHIIHREKTDKPLMKKGEPQYNEAGKIIHEVKEYVPKFDFNTLPEFFTVTGINPRVEKNLLLYHNGLLKRLKERGVVSVDSGKVTSTGFPGEYKIYLNDKNAIEEMQMLKSIRWYKEEVVNNIHKEIYPEIDIGEKHVVMVLNGLNLTKDTIYRGLEQFSNFYKIKLKNIFTIEDDCVTFSYQTKLKRVFVFGDSIPNKARPDSAKLDQILGMLKQNPEFSYTSAPELRGLYLDFFDEYIGVEDVEEKEKVFNSHFPKLDYKHFSKLIEDSIEGARPNMWKEWNQKIIGTMKSIYEKTGTEEVFLGELEDPNINWKTQIFWKLTQSPHMLVVGQTRSGKTRSVLSLVSTLKRAYPRSPFLFGDGKSSVDYDVFAQRMSDYPVAKPAKGEDPLIELANLVMIAWREYERRQNLFGDMQKKGNSCTTYVQYNQYCKTEEEKLGRFFLVIDEFAAFRSLAPDSVDKLMAIEGTIFYYLKRLLAEGASFGFTIILASQRAQSDSFPTPIRSNLTTWMIHSVNSKDAAFLGLEGVVEKLGPGKFVLKVPGLWCPDTGSNLFKATLPYIGDNEGDIIELMDCPMREHKEFNMDLLYNTGQDVNNKNMDIPTLYRYIKQAFISREGYEILESHDPNFRYLSLVFRDNEDREYAIAIVSGDEISHYGFLSKLMKEREDIARFNLVVFVVGKARIDWEKIEEFGRTTVLQEVDFMRPLKEAFELNKQLDPTPVFGPLLDIENKNDANVDKLYNPKAQDNIINLTELNRIKNIQGAVEKGDAFEEWVKTFEERLGHNTVKARDLVDDGIVKDIFANKRAEGGLDLCRWIDKENRVAVGIQCKNQTSKNLNSAPINKLLKTQKLYKQMGVDFKDLILVTTGKLTKQANEEAQRCGITVINGSMLEKMVEEYNKDKKNGAKSKKGKTNSPSKKKSAKKEAKKEEPSWYSEGEFEKLISKRPDKDKQMKALLSALTDEIKDDEAK